MNTKILILQNIIQLLFLIFTHNFLFGQCNQPTTNVLDLEETDGVKIVGTEDYEKLGFTVNEVGDFNGDGFNDFMIGAIQSYPNSYNEPGKVYVIFGTGNNLSSSFKLSDINGSNGFIIYGNKPTGDLGVSINSLGDINDDGFDDIIMATGTAAAGPLSEGDICVIYGTNNVYENGLHLNDINGENGFIITREYEYSYFGRALGKGGDVNNDGINDIILGNPSGFVHIIYGNTNGFSEIIDVDNLDENVGFTIKGKYQQRFWWAVDIVDDVNGDGISDILVGAPNYGLADDEQGWGACYVIFGKNGNFPNLIDVADLNGENGFLLVGEKHATGISVHGIGDFNIDGVNDFIVRSDGSDKNGVVIFGRTDGFPEKVLVSELGFGEGFDVSSFDLGYYNRYGLRGVSDINNDGIKDLLLGNFTDDEVYVLLGGHPPYATVVQLDLLDGTERFKYKSNNDFFGYAVDGIGDINGDGIGDIVVGAYSHSSDGFDDNGAVYVIYGKCCITYFEDFDGDGLGNPDVTTGSCQQPEGFIDNADDTNDDCIGFSDECGVCGGTGIPEGECDCNGALPLIWYEDFDGDGLGNLESTILSCEQIEGYVSNSDDDCDELDDECGVCDGPGIPEGYCDCTTPIPAWFFDNDGDGLGGDIFIFSCEQPVGTVNNSNDDCDGEFDVCGVCNGNSIITQNCDCQQMILWFADIDGDGLGNPAIFINSCTQPLGYVSNNFDDFEGFITSNETISDIEYMTIFPNPVYEALNIKINQLNTPSSIRIFNISGQLMIQKSISYYSTSHQINTSDLDSGMYILEIETLNKTYIQKIIVK